MAAVACGNLIACLVALPMALPIADSNAVDWFLVLFLGVFQIAVAYIFLIRGLQGMGALEVSLLLLLEPVLNPIWAWLVLGERPDRVGADRGDGDLDRHGGQGVVGEPGA